MKQIPFLMFFLCLGLVACASPKDLPPSPTATQAATRTQALTPSPAVSDTPEPSPTLRATATATATAAFAIQSADPEHYPLAGYGPQDFPADINPLTGLRVSIPALLDRRPVLVKISNLPRDIRPQWGLSFADHVFEYYTEEGTTRFAAVFYGQDAEKAGSIRSGRLMDHHLLNMYKGILAFGSADYRVRDLFYTQSYADRLVIETSCPPMCRYEPKGANILYTNTADVTKYIRQRNVPGGNTRQNLDGLLFNYKLPSQGKPASQVFVRYSAAIYNRWDYDPAQGVYLRFVDTQNDFDNKKEVYAPLIDRLNKQQIQAENVVVLYITHEYFSREPEMVDIMISGPGKAMLFRDGQSFELTWYRNGQDKILTLADAQGKLFPLKPGKTWFEVLGSKSKMTDDQAGLWRFLFQIP